MAILITKRYNLKKNIREYWIHRNIKTKDFRGCSGNCPTKNPSRFVAMSDNRSRLDKSRRLLAGCIRQSSCNCIVRTIEAHTLLCLPATAWRSATLRNNSVATLEKSRWKCLGDTKGGEISPFNFHAPTASQRRNFTLPGFVTLTWAGKAEEKRRENEETNEKKSGKLRLVKSCTMLHELDGHHQSRHHDTIDSCPSEPVRRVGLCQRNFCCTRSRSQKKRQASRRPSLEFGVVVKQIRSFSLYFGLFCFLRDLSPQNNASIRHTRNHIGQKKKSLARGIACQKYYSIIITRFVWLAFFVFASWKKSVTWKNID